MRNTTSLALIASKPSWREADARVLVEGWRRSGESLPRFARRHGIDEQRLRRWADRLTSEQAGMPARRVAFHPVRVTNGGDAGERTRQAACELRLANGRGLRVPEGFNLEYLSRLLAVLEALT